MECLGFLVLSIIIKLWNEILGKKTASQWLKIISVLNYTLLIKEVGIQVHHRKCDVSYVNQQQHFFSLF